VTAYNHDPNCTFPECDKRAQYSLTSFARLSGQGIKLSLLEPPRRRVRIFASIRRFAGAALGTSGWRHVHRSSSFLLLIARLSTRS